MIKTKLTIHFNLRNKRDKRIYTGLKNLPEYFGENDMSEAFIKFMDNFISSFLEYEEKIEEYENVLDLDKRVQH